MGPGPDWQTAPGSGPSAALVGDVRRARVAGRNREGREASDGWATTQCRAAVPLTGGVSLSVGTGADARGPAREETETGHPDAQ
jgi:hypothetical protein